MTGHRKAVCHTLTIVHVACRLCELDHFRSTSPVAVATAAAMRDDCVPGAAWSNAMSNEAANVAVLTEAYQRWHDSRGGSVDHWMSICDENIQFGSLAQGAPKVSYLASYATRDA